MITMQHFDLVKIPFQAGTETDAIKVSTTSHVCILESGWSEYKLDLVS